jgi:hypothetical protein
LYVVAEKHRILGRIVNKNEVSLPTKFGLPEEKRKLNWEMLKFQLNYNNGVVFVQLA